MKILQMIFFGFIQLYFILEFWYPILQESVVIFNTNKHRNFSFQQIAELVKFIIKLAGPSVVAWLLGFLVFFHLWLNILSEVIRYADRGFYKDWWNCCSLEEYWRKWNLPVHHWFKKHLHYPLIHRGWDRNVVGSIIFMASALGHEFLISLAIKKLGKLVFVSFFLQYFYILAEKIILQTLKLHNTRIGNYFFWFNVCMIGQPYLAIVYYRDFVNQGNHPISTLPTSSASVPMGV